MNIHDRDVSLRLRISSILSGVTVPMNLIFEDCVFSFKKKKRKEKKRKKKEKKKGTWTNYPMDLIRNVPRN